MRILTRTLAQLSVALGLFLGADAHSAQAQGCTYESVAFTGQTAPGGGTYHQFLPPRIAQNGEIAFIGLDAASESPSQGVFCGLPDSLVCIAASGVAIPDGKGVFADFTSVSLAEDGRVSFNAGISYDGYSRGIWMVNSQGIVKRAQTSSIAIQDLGPASFRSGEILAKGSFYAAGGDLAEQALFQGASLSTALVSGAVLDGRRVQKIYDAYEYLYSSVGAEVDSNETGAVVFKAAVSPSADPTPYPVETLYAGTPGKLASVATAGDSAPGLSGEYAHFSPRPSISAGGTLAFSAILTTNGESSTTGIFSGLAGAISEKVLEGQAVPTTTNVVFGALSDAVVNSTGDVIFRATIRYPNESTRQGIWIKRQTGAPVLIAVDGMTLQTPGGPREVTGVDFAGPGTFNDLHQFVFLAKFGDTDEGVYIADTRPGAPFITVTRPRKPREFVTTAATVKVIGKALDDTGVQCVRYTVSRERSIKKNKAKKWIVSRPRRAEGSRNWNFEVPLSMGLNLISITATDKLGNVSEPYKIRMLRYKAAK